MAPDPLIKTMTRNVDVLTSSTLKHLRERWWDESFTNFLKDTLQPKSGRRILDVGCGTGTAEVNLSRLRLTQVNFFAVDLLLERVAAALAAARATNFRARFAVADACALPFPNASFDSTFCVAVLQHINDAPRAVGEMARVTRPTGRVLAVEPDNAARYFYSSTAEGMEAHDAAARLFATIQEALGEAGDPASVRGCRRCLRKAGSSHSAFTCFQSRAHSSASPPTKSGKSAGRRSATRSIERPGNPFAGSVRTISS